MENKKSKSLSIKQLFYLSLPAFGLQVASTLEVNNASGIFKFFGAEDHHINLLWLLPPLAGLIIQPVLGQLSDLIDTKYGKRVPLIVGGAVLACLSLLTLIFTKQLWFSALMILLLSCSLNCAIEGLRALLGDVTPNNQKPTAFSWQAVCSSVGALFASLIPWAINFLPFADLHSNVNSAMPLILKICFLLGAIILAFSVFFSLKNMRDLTPSNSKNSVRTQSFLKLLSKAWRELWASLKETPVIIKKLFWVQCLSWAGMFCIWLYFSLALSQKFFHLPSAIDINSNSLYQNLLKKGMIQTNFCFAIYQLVSVLYALCIPVMTKRVSQSSLHAFSLIVGGVSVGSIVAFDSLNSVYYSMIGLGVFWGSLCSLPYSIVAAEIPDKKMGASLGVFNITITLPQIVCGIAAGLVYEHIFSNHAVYMLVMGSFFIVLAGILLYSLQYKLELQKLLRTLRSVGQRQRKH